MNSKSGVLGLLLLGSTATAGGPVAWQVPSAIHVDNDSGAQAEIYVDGSWRGSVRPGDERTFSAVPGSHNLQATWSDGSPLLTQLVVTTIQRPSAVRLLPPMSTLELMHHGAAPVWVELAGIAPFWMLPGSTQTVQLGGTAAVISTWVYGRAGLLRVGETQVALRPGCAVRAEVGWTAPPPTSTVTMFNQEDHLLRVYIGGQEVAVVPPGQARTWEVMPGRTGVLVVEQQGRVIFDQSVTFDPRRDHQIRVVGGRPYVDGAGLVATR